MHPLVRQLDELCRKDGRSMRTIERKAGVGKDTLNRWVKGHSRYAATLGPSLMLFETMLNALGYELRIVKRGEGE